MDFTEKQIAMISRFGLGKDLISLNEVENWAQRVFSTSGSGRTDGILELCNATDFGLNPTIHELHKLEATIDQTLVQTIYGLIFVRFKNGDISLKQACYAVEQSCIEMFRETGKHVHGMSLDDSFYLAESKIYGTLEAVEKEFLDLTKAHEKLGREFLETIT